MISLLPLFKDLMRAAACWMQAALRRSILIGLTLLFAIAGAVFCLMAGFLGLCLLIRPELAALVMGIALFFVAAGIFWYSCSIGQKAQLPVPSLELQASIDGAPTTPATAATVIVFTAAFLFGRRLANWRGSFQNS